MFASSPERGSFLRGVLALSVKPCRACQLSQRESPWQCGKVSGSSAKFAGVSAPPGGAVAQRLRGYKSAEPEKTVKRSSRRTGVNLQFFPVELTSLGLKGASSPFFVAPARRNRWHFSGSLLVSKENIPRLRGFSQFSYFFASFIRLRFSSRMRSSTTFTALRMRALGMRTASVAHG